MAVVTYKGLKLLDPDATGAGGKAINLNFRTLADVDEAQSALIDLRVPTSRTVTGAGLLSGGGDLSDDRTLTLTGDTVLTDLLTRDGSGSGLDADLLRGTIPSVIGLSVLGMSGTASSHQTLGVNAAGTAWALRTPGWLDTAQTWTQPQAFDDASFSVNAVRISDGMFLGSGKSINWRSSSSASGGSTDVQLLRGAAGRIQINAPLAVASAGSLSIAGRTSTNTRVLADAATEWIDSTDATRKARVTWSVYDTAAREFLRADATGSGSRVGVNGAVDAAAVLQVTGATSGADPVLKVNNGTAAGRALQVQATDCTNVAMMIMAPLSSSLTTGRAFGGEVSGESFARFVFYTDGKYGVGSGSGDRDVFLSRSATNTWRVSSDGGSGAAHLRINGNLILSGVPTYADNAAAVAGGLATNTVYKTSTGELRIVV